MNLFKATSFLFLALTGLNAAVSDEAPAAVIAETNLRHLAAKSNNGNGGGSSSDFVNIIVELNEEDVDDSMPAADSDGSWSGPPGLADKAEKKRSNAAAFAREKGLSPYHTYGATIHGFSAQNVPKGQLKKLEDDPAVKSVEIDRVVTIDPKETIEVDDLFGRRQMRRLAPDWKEDEAGAEAAQIVPYGITRVGAEILDPDDVDLAGKRACVLDSGIDLYNSDLNVADDCFNAFRSGRDSRSCMDNNGHGTHVAGTIAAIDNAIDVVGVAPGATVVAVKVLGGNGSGSWSGVIAGMDWAATNDCHVVNMSLGGSRDLAVNNAAIRLGMAGVKVVLAAGNESSDAYNSSPASAGGTNIYTVSASDTNDNFAGFSNYGDVVDVAAPGVNVASLRVGGGVVSYSGTSMAAPHVAGLLLLGDDLCFDGMVKGDRDGNPDEIAFVCTSPPPKTTTTGATTTQGTATTQGTTVQTTTTGATTTTRATATTTQTCLGWNARCNSNRLCCSPYQCNWKGRCKN